MRAKSRIISPFLFFFVFLLVLSTIKNLVLGDYDQYQDCMDYCTEYVEDTTEEAMEMCVAGCQDLKNGRNGLVHQHFDGVAILEANPKTLMAPGHCDVDALFFVARGKATINLFRRDKRETLGLKAGDIIRIPSGTKVFMINKDTMEKLVVIKLPGQPAGQSEIKLLNPFRQSSDDHEVKLFNPFGESSSDEVKLLNPFRVSSLHQVEEGTESSVN